MVTLVLSTTARLRTTYFTSLKLMNDSQHSHWGNFFQFNIGHLLIILGMCGSAVWWFITYDREITLTKVMVGSLTITVDRLATKVENMDEHGTRFSQFNLGKDGDLIKSNFDHVLKLEEISSQMQPKVDRMDYNLTAITEWVKGQQNKKL